MSPRTLVYAMGGGLGHLTRVRAFFAANDILRSDTPIDDDGCFAVDPADAPIFLSASPHLTTITQRMGARSVSPPEALNGQREAFRAWFADTLRELRIERLIVDAFPRGILGELDGDVVPAAVDVWHLARRLRFARYQQRGAASDALPFSRIFTLEPLEADHAAWLASTGATMTPLALVDPPQPPSSAVAAIIDGGPCTLVVHAGDRHERETLRRRAHAAVAAGRAPARVVEVFADVDATLLYPAESLWAHAAHVVSGAGFNAMRHGAGLGAAHDAVAFDRALDDQHWRLEWHRRRRDVASGIARDDGAPA